jgi:hypothetical protein
MAQLDDTDAARFTMSLKKYTLSEEARQEMGQDIVGMFTGAPDVICTGGPQCGTLCAPCLLAVVKALKKAEEMLG